MGTMSTIGEKKQVSNENQAQNSIVEDARLYPETTGERLGQIVRFELNSVMEPATKPTEPSTSLGHITTDEERSFRGRHADVRQKARQVLEDLLEGNARFRKGQLIRCKADLDLLEELIEEQAPGAVILSCSDSRCPPELVLDQGLGDLLVVRVAGNVVNDFVMGSIVNAVQMNDVRLVMVLGHTRCGMVARAVHSWAKHEAQKLQKGQPNSSEAGSTAASPHPKTPEQTTPSLPISKSARSGDSASPDAAEAAGQKPEAGKSGNSGGGGGGFFERICACGRPQPPHDNGAHETATVAAGSGDAEPFADSPPLGKSPSMPSGGRRQSLGRLTIERLSTNPIGAIIGSIQTAVDNVHSNHQQGRLSHIVSRIHKNEEMKDLGFTGLQTQDSLGITRARLAKRRLNENMTLLNQIKDMEGVEEVATQNTVLNAKAVLKGLVKCVDAAIVQEVEVVAAKYDLESGKVTIVKRGWYSGRSFYYE